MARKLPPLPPPIRGIDREPWKPSHYLDESRMPCAIPVTNPNLAPEARHAAGVATSVIARLRVDTSTPERAHRARSRWTPTPAIVANVQAAHARMLTAFVNGQYRRRPPRIDPYA